MFCLHTVSYHCIEPVKLDDRLNSIALINAHRYISATDVINWTYIHTRWQRTVGVFRRVRLGSSFTLIGEKSKRLIN